MSNEMMNDSDEKKQKQLFVDMRKEDSVGRRGVKCSSKAVISGLSAVLLSVWMLVTPVLPSNAVENPAGIAVCLFQKCPAPLLKCIANPKCLANVICINTCNNKADEIGCQIECGDLFENEVVGEFNKCAVSDLKCVPQKADDGSYPVPPASDLVQKFDTSIWNGRWYISAGQNKLFDCFPCQVHFFTETQPGKFFGKLNWRIEEPDGEFLSRDALQKFVQDPNQPAHLINHDNDYLHYQDDWYILDYEPDNNPSNTPPFVVVYYRGENDAWIGYGGVVIYTRDASFPEAVRDRVSAAVRKVGFDFERDFTLTDNSCKTQTADEILLLREKFAGKVALQTEQQLQAEAIRLRSSAVNAVEGEVKEVENALRKIEQGTENFENEIIKDIARLEQELVKDIAVFEKEIVKDILAVEKELQKDAIIFEKEIQKDIVGVEQEVVKDVTKFQLFFQNKK